MQPCWLGEGIEKIQSSCGDEKLERDPPRSPHEKSYRRPEIDSEAARTDSDGSAEQIKGTLGPLVTDQGEGMLQGEAD